MRRQASKFLGLFFTISLCADCNSPSQWQRITLKHKEANGIGYDSGYTSLDLFLAKQLQPDQVYFLDARGHVLNTGSFALNAGLGLRYLLKNRQKTLLGINGYYDYRVNKGLSFNQVGIGLEALAAKWEARLNGYLPIGGRNQLESEQIGAYVPLQFTKNNLVVAQAITQTYTSPLGEIDAEIGYHFQPTAKKDLDLYFGVGPYYLQIANGAAAAGGAARVALSMSRFITVTGNYSYDRFFKNIVQGEIAINVPFGPRESLDALEKSSDCDAQFFLNQRPGQEVYRQEILPIRSTQQGNFGETGFAIDPRTGQPYRFIFVDNTSNSEGTFESPYPMLLEAENNSSPYDIIYVYPGDGTSKGMNQGIALQDYQMLWGASTAHSLMIDSSSIPIALPPLSSGLPIITNTIGDVVALANANQISGFQVVVDGGNGITGSSIIGPVIEQNIFTTARPDTVAIVISSFSNSLTVSSSSFDQFTQSATSTLGGGINLTVDQLVDEVLIENCRFTNFYSLNSSGQNHATVGLSIPTGGLLNKFNTRDNSFVNTGTLAGGLSFGIISIVSGGTLEESNHSNNTFKYFNEKSFGLSQIVSSGQLNSSIIDNCSFSQFIGGSSPSEGGSGILFLCLGGEIHNPTVRNSDFTDFYTGRAVAYLGKNTNTFTNVSTENCTFNQFSNTSRGILYEVIDDTSFQNVSVSNCTFNGIDNSEGILIDYNKGTVDNFSILNSSFNNITSQGNGIKLQMFDGTFDSFTISNSQFVDITNSNGINAEAQGGTLGSLAITNGTFTGNVVSDFNGVNFNFTGGEVTNASIASSTFNEIANLSFGLNVNQSNATNLMILNVENNQFYTSVGGAGNLGW
ncbi:MAG: inverse autotransporter beta domain-containing protein, partial [Chlamydiia bacterium]